MEGYGVKATEIRVVGGGSKNRLWRRIIADSFQLPLRFPTEPESAALGAALQAAAVHAGVATPEFIDSHSPPLADLVSRCVFGPCSASLLPRMSVAMSIISADMCRPSHACDCICVCDECRRVARPLAKRCLSDEDTCVHDGTGGLCNDACLHFIAVQLFRD